MKFRKIYFEDCKRIGLLIILNFKNRKASYNDILNISIVFMKKFHITNKARKYPSLPYEQIKNDILGHRYSLSLVFIGGDRAKKLNKHYRDMNYIPDVLSFPIDTNIGEIFITPVGATKEASKFNMTQVEYIGFLFIHACLHLKGLNHGNVMDKLEKKYCTKYNFC